MARAHELYVTWHKCPLSFRTVGGGPDGYDFHEDFHAEIRNDLAANTTYSTVGVDSEDNF